MKATIKVALAVSMLAATGSLSFAGHKYKRHQAAPYAAPYPQGARMIELRRGWWVSNYECFTDEGYGRFRSCSASN